MAGLAADPENGGQIELSRGHNNEEKLNLKQSTPKPGISSKFEGKRRQQWALWAHNMGLVAALSLLCFGMFGILWKRSGTYSCKVRGKPISSKLIKLGTTVDGRAGMCVSRSYTFANVTVARRSACCDPNGRSGSPRDLGGSTWIGYYCIIAGFVLFMWEANTERTFGLWMPADSVWYKAGLSPNGMLFTLSSAVAFMTRATCTAGLLSFCAGLCYCWAAKRGEAGDGGRGKRREARKSQGPVPRARKSWHDWAASYVSTDAISTTFWVGLYFASNVVLFIHTLYSWVVTIQIWELDLRQDDVKLDGCDECPSLSLKPYTRWRDECALNRALVRHGPLSFWAPIAKASGVTLNLNCALLLLPVTKSVLIFLNELASGYRAAQRRSAWFEAIFRSPFARYLPLAKNIEFHKLIACVVCFFSLLHTVAHFFNYWQAPSFTAVRFAKWGWAGTTFLTGAIILVAMFAIFTASNAAVRNANFEIFWVSHHCFIVFYIMLLLHGPVFYWWGLVPICLYAYDRRSRALRGSKPFLVSRVEWVAPVLSVHFRPLDKADFDFQEGTYVLLNCPFVSEHEWHPFTISSAHGDLVTGSRLSLETGEPVVAVPQPQSGGTSSTFKWKKFCPITKDPAQPANILEAHETAYHDYVSVHIKVHGDHTWTHKLKDYFEMMSPSQTYPFHLTRRDERGEVQLGRRLGPDSRPILRVDGPHTAPATHYRHYGTVMIIGAGIGMTPCASILTAMLKYRWRLNFKPEILHFYWVCAYADVRAFEWFVRLLTDLEFELAKARKTGAVANRNYCEINIYVTRPPEDAVPPPPMKSRPPKLFRRPGIDCEPQFAAEDLWAELMRPKAPASTQIETMRKPNADNRFQDIWVWKGRPEWRSIFSSVKAQRQHRDIGVLFCGTPAIGADLASMCKQASSPKDDCIFTLHKVRPAFGCL